MVIRGRSQHNPVLLWVHGGPGMPDYLLTEQYATNLEDLFTVVWWDQRGAALSYHPTIPPETMTIEQFISDTLAVTDYLRQRFHQEKIFLLGYSWGSLIAIQAAARSPERYHAYGDGADGAPGGVGEDRLRLHARGVSQAWGRRDGP
jgi:pimeloyl-ACP methyl ester carboxylesterase